MNIGNKPVNTILEQSDIRPETRRVVFERIRLIYDTWQRNANRIISYTEARFGGSSRVELPLMNDAPFDPTGPAEFSDDPVNIITYRVTFERVRRHTNYEEIVCEGLTVWRRYD